MILNTGQWQRWKRKLVRETEGKRSLARYELFFKKINCKVIAK